MTDTPLTEQIRDVLRAELAPMRAQLDGLRADLNGLRSEVAPMRAQLDGMPLINRTATVIQQEVRALRAAFNDFALTNPTSGEIEAFIPMSTACRPKTRNWPRA